MTAGIKLSGFAELQMRLNPARFTAALRKEVRRATALNGKLAVREVRKVIKGGMEPTNAPLTVMIKRSSKPLVNHGDLWAAIASTVVDDYTAFVGVNRKNGAYDVAVGLHEGTTTRVSEKMRMMFRNLWEASQGTLDPSHLTGRAAELWARMPGGWLPLKKDTQFIVTPPRPFIVAAFRSPELHAQARANWEAAVQRAFLPSGGQG